MTLSISSASYGERQPNVRARAASRSAWLIGLSCRMKLAAISSLSGGSALRSSTMFSRGLTTLTVHRRDGPGKQQQGSPVLENPLPQQLRQVFVYVAEIVGGQRFERHGGASADDALVRQHRGRHRLQHVHQVAIEQQPEVDQIGPWRAGVSLGDRKRVA